MASVFSVPFSEIHVTFAKELTGGLPIDGDSIWHGVGVGHSRSDHLSATWLERTLLAFEALGRVASTMTTSDA